MLVLFGEKNSPNLGDAVICNVAQHFFRLFSGRKGLIVQDISFLLRGNDIYLNAIRRICEVLRINHAQLDYFYYSCKLFFSIRSHSTICYVGGELLLDFFMPQILLVLRIAYLKKCSLVCLSLGMGSISTDNLYKLKKYLTRLTTVDLTLRDHVVNFCNEVDNRAKWSPDIAILSYRVYGNKQKRKNVVGIGCIDINLYNRINPKNPVSYKKYFNSICQLIETLFVNNFSVELFCNGDWSDYNMSISIYDSLPSKEKVSLRARPSSDKELVEIISSYSLVISSRLHSLIIAYSYEIPFIGIEWEEKVTCFAKTINCNHRVVKMCSIDDIGEQMVHEALTNSYDLQQKKYYEEIVLSRIRGIVKKAY